MPGDVRPSDGFPKRDLARRCFGGVGSFSRLIIDSAIFTARLHKEEREPARSAHRAILGARRTG